MSTLSIGAIRGADSAASAGIRDIIPVLLGVTPFGVTIGGAIVDSPISNPAGWLGGPLIAAGSAHLAVVTMVGAGASAAVIVLTALLINARLAAYSAILAPVFSHQPTWFRWLAPYVLVDQNFALVMARQEAHPDWLRRYYMTATSILWAVWLLAITAGMTLGPIIPAGWELWFGIPLLFCGMAVPAVRTKPSLTAAGTAAIFAVVLSGLASGLGVVAAVAIGAAAGALHKGRSHD